MNRQMKNLISTSSTGVVAVITKVVVVVIVYKLSAIVFMWKMREYVNLCNI